MCISVSLICTKTLNGGGGANGGVGPWTVVGVNMARTYLYVDKGVFVDIWYWDC